MPLKEKLRTFLNDPLLFFPGYIIWTREGERLDVLEESSPEVRVDLLGRICLIRKAMDEDVDATFNFINDIILNETT